MNRIVIFYLILAFWSLNAIAQSTLEIRVINPQQNQPLSGIEVIITHSGSSRQLIRTSNSLGQLQVQVPMTGHYHIGIADTLNYVLLETAILQVRNLESFSVAIWVVPIREKQLESVEVHALQYSPTKLNTLNAEVSSELHEQELRDLPVEGRDITRALYRLPNVAQATGFFPEAPNVAINGANSLYTSYLIDGMDNNENFLGGQRFAMPVGFTENISVLTNNFSSEYGQTANGIINLTSKSGTNARHGEAYYTLRPGAWTDAPSAYAQRDLSGNQVKDGFQRHQTGASLGGPIKENQLFYFVNVEYTRDNKDNLLTSPALGVQETVPGKNDFLYLSGKMDHFGKNGNHTALRINQGNIAIERQGGGLTGGLLFPSAGNIQRRNSLNLALTHNRENGAITSNTSLLYGRFHWDYADPSNGQSPNVTVLDSTGQAIAFIGHPGYVFDERENTLQAHQKFTWQKGSHHFKTGFTLKNTAFTLFGGGNPDGSYTVRLSSAQQILLAQQNHGANLNTNDLPADVEVVGYAIELRPRSFQKNQLLTALYFEDQLTVSDHLNLVFGLRYDLDNLSRGGSNQADLNNLAPRFSANYRLSEKSSLRLGYGMFYEKILYALYSDAVQFSSTSTDFQRQVKQLQQLGLLDPSANVASLVSEGNLSAYFNTTTYLQGPTAASLPDRREQLFSNELRILNPGGYDNPYSHQFTLGFQQQIDPKLLLSINVMHNESYRLFRLTNLNAPAPLPGIYDAGFTPQLVRSVPEADQSRPVPILTDNSGSYTVMGNDTLRGIARNIVMTETEGRSRYSAVAIGLNKLKKTDWYAFRFNYTLSRLENDTEDINFRAMDGNNFAKEWGPSLNDRRHNFNSFVTLYPLQAVSVTLAGISQSGQPINRIPDGTYFGTTDLNGDGRSFSDAYQGNNDRSPGEPRNSDRLPWSHTFDLAVRYQLAIGETGQLEWRADVFNLLNTVNLSGYANNATQSNQIQSGPAGSGIVIRNTAPPRQFQFSISYLF